MNKPTKEIVIYQYFDEDGKPEREYTPPRTRNVYTTKKGKIWINYLDSRRTIIREDGRLICFGGQRMPVRQSAMSKWRAEE